MASGVYKFVQLLINALIVFVVSDSIAATLMLTAVFAILFLGMRFMVEGKERLLKGEG